MLHELHRKGFVSGAGSLTWVTTVQLPPYTQLIDIIQSIDLEPLIKEAIRSSWGRTLCPSVFPQGHNRKSASRSSSEVVISQLQTCSSVLCLVILGPGLGKPHFSCASLPLLGSPNRWCYKETGKLEEKEKDFLLTVCFLFLVCVPAALAFTLAVAAGLSSGSLFTVCNFSSYLELVL